MRKWICKTRASRRESRARRVSQVPRHRYSGIDAPSTLVLILRHQYSDIDTPNTLALVCQHQCSDINTPASTLCHQYS